MPFDPVKASIHANLPNRFCYWKGQRGHSYLFSRIQLKDLSSFDDCILLISIETTDQAPELFWIGHIADLPNTILHSLKSLDSSAVGLYVHLLAGNTEGQLEVITDLSGKQTQVPLVSVA
jgi:hypothetical protein